MDSSFGLIGLVASFGIAYLYEPPIQSGWDSFWDYLACCLYHSISFLATKTGNSVCLFLTTRPFCNLIILGLVNGYIYQWFINHNVQIKMPDGGTQQFQFQHSLFQVQ